MVDTCCDPTDIDFVIPANDDAAKSIALVLDVCCGAIEEGLAERKLEREKEAANEAAAPKKDAPRKRTVKKERVAKSEENAEA